MATRRWGGLPAATALCVAIVASACSSEQAASTRTDPTIRQETTTTGPFTPPEIIDVDWVDRVLEELARLEGDAFRSLVATRELTVELVGILRTLYVSDVFLGLVLDEMVQEFELDFDIYREVPGDRRLTATELISARPDCVFVEISRDNSALLREAQEPSVNWVALVPVSDELDPTGINTTGWGYLYFGFQSDRTAPPDPCEELR